MMAYMHVLNVGNSEHSVVPLITAFERSINPFVATYDLKLCSAVHCAGAE